jgi:hypothetical protein
MPALGLVSRFQDRLFVLVADQDAARASAFADTLDELGSGIGVGSPSTDSQSIA